MLTEYVLSNDNIRIGILELGATITFIEMPDREGRWKNIVAGFADRQRYWQNDYYLGSVVGRYANRIGKGQFMLDGRMVQLSLNNGGNHLHGGCQGFDRRIWSLHARIETDSEKGLVLEYISPDGEEGYPGNLRVRVSYILEKSGRFLINYSAVTDQSTPVNLTNHSYFNLSGFEQPVIDDHWLRVYATEYTEKNGMNLPTGRLLPLAGTALDLSVSRRIGDLIGQLPVDKGFDHNYVIHPNGREGPAPAVDLYDPASGRQLSVLTDRPGVQVYTANWWDGTVIGQQGIPYIRHGAIALETQAFPDSPNQPGFSDTILRPDQEYRSTTIFEFAIK